MRTSILQGMGVLTFFEIFYFATFRLRAHYVRIRSERDVLRVNAKKIIVREFRRRISGNKVIFRKEKQSSLSLCLSLYRTCSSSLGVKKEGMSTSKLFRHKNCHCSKTLNIKVLPLSDGFIIRARKTKGQSRRHWMESESDISEVQFISQ